ncbi:BlaR1 peptidase M56, partial [Anaerobacterium chartisolvens]
LADHIVSPFVIGLFRPKIYLPSTLAEHEQSYIILHEQTHIRRFDHVMKIVAFAALCIHWFNPLVWIAFTLTIKDMEMSCDESVMKRLGANIREEYSALLLSLATGRKIIAGTPLAFGEGDTKSRIKNVLRYKKPALWVMLAALIVVSAICIAFASNPPRTSMEWAKKLRVEDVVKIELVVMASDEDARYRLFDRSEFSDVVALVNKSRGGYLPNPESLAGSGVTYYITTTDGVRHIFSNNGYLFIDGDSYDAGHHWLSSWGNVKGNAPLPEPFLFGNENFLTLDELKLIAQKGDAISWDDFASYHGQDVGSGLYIMRYPMEPPYYVMVGGVPGEPPMYVRLYSTETEQYIDIRQESIDDFIQKSDNENGSNSTIESIAWEFINDNIVNYEQTPGVEIIDSKISFLELVTRPGLDNLADRTIYVFFLEYRLLPKDLSKVVLAGGMDVDEQGWITERSSMGQPLIVAFEEEGKAELIGFLWTAEISEKNGGLEAAVKDLLEQKNDN